MTVTPKGGTTKRECFCGWLITSNATRIFFAKGQATNHYAGLLECMGLRVGSATVGGKHSTPPIYLSVSDVGCRGVETLLSLTELLGSLRCLKSTFRGAGGFGLGTEKYEN